MMYLLMSCFERRDIKTTGDNFIVPFFQFFLVNNSGDEISYIKF